MRKNTNAESRKNLRLRDAFKIILRIQKRFAISARELKSKRRHAYLVLARREAVRELKNAGFDFYEIGVFLNRCPDDVYHLFRTPTPDWNREQPLLPRS